MTTEYKMPPLRANGKTPTGSATPNVTKIVQPETTPAPVAPALPNAPQLQRPGVLGRLKEWTHTALAEERKRADKGRGFWGEHPPSLTMLREWLGTTRWARSEVGLLKGAAWLYGHLVALPLTVVLYLIAWTVQRPLRLISAALLLWIIIHFS